MPADDAVRERQPEAGALADRLRGLADVWVPPIRNRIDMLATGINGPWA